MADFARWLAKQEQPSNVELQLLKDFSKQHSADWPYAENDITDYISVVLEKAPEAVRKQLLVSLVRNHQQWQETQRTQVSGDKGWRNWINDNPGMILLGLGVAAIVGVLGWGIASDTFLRSVSDREYARGLITFLFAFSTIAVFLVIAVANFWMDKEEVKERYGSAKDLLTIVIGIMGTILGFYFGSDRSPPNATAARSGSTASAGTNQTTATQLRLENVSASAVSRGGTSTITANIRGGTAPYTYSVTFDAPPTVLAAAAFPKIENRRVSGDTISEQVRILPEANIQTQVAVKVNIVARDVKGATDQRETTLTLQP